MNSTPWTPDAAPAFGSPFASAYAASQPIPPAVSIACGMSHAEAFEILADPLIDQASQRAHAVIESADPESLHKLRVALRRLRSLWWAYTPLVANGLAREHRRTFKALADSAGLTRDWDILKEVALEDPALGNAFAELSGDIAELRQASLLTSRKVLGEVDMAAWLGQRKDAVLLQLGAHTIDESLEDFAATRVAAAHQALKKHIQKLLWDPVPHYDDFHRVRIAGKKLRYLLEFFSPLTGESPEHGVEELTRMQNRLGALNDIASSEALLRAHAVALGGMERVASIIAVLTERRMRHMIDAMDLIRELNTI